MMLLRAITRHAQAAPQGVSPATGPAMRRAARGTLLALALLVAPLPALAGNEGFAPGNCTSPGRTMPSITSILEFQKYLPTSAAIAGQVAPAHLVGAITDPSAKLRIKGKPVADLLADAQARLAARPAPQITHYYIHPAGISLEVTETATRQGDLIHVIRRCAFYLTPKRAENPPAMMGNFGPLKGIAPSYSRADTDLGRIATKFHAYKGTPRATTETGKDSAGGYLWMANLTTNDTGLPDGWQPGMYILTEMSDYLTPEHYRTE